MPLFNQRTPGLQLDLTSHQEVSRPRTKPKRSEKHGSEKGHATKPSKESIQEIRLFLKQHYLRERSHDAALDILYGRNTISGEKTDYPRIDQQIYFDLSGYTMLTRRRLQKGLKNVKFDDTLQYVDVPRITIEGTEAIANTSKARGTSTRADPNGNGRTDLVFIFHWLRNKGVGTILKVVVDDLGSQAHGDEAIEEATKDFGIEVWNWKKTDLCAEVIIVAAPGVKVVHLYWTGNNAVLRGWCDVGGLKKLERLRAHDWIKCMTDFKRLLNEAEANFARTENTKIEDEIEDPIKVALIDDGININELEYTPIGGRSFCPRNEDKSHNYPYYVSSSGHGTVMASQIYRICPRAQLYVLKIEDHADENGSRQITARSAAQAIRAAVGRGVHIISMSWTLEPPSDERARADLDSAIALAVSHKILLFCSASDSGAREDVSYPFTASPRHIFRIGGAYASGATDADVGSTSRIDFTFPGNNVEVASSFAGGGGGGGGGGEKFKYRTGSSVATALAAGLAALILYCVQVRLLRARKDETEAVRAQFRRLTEHDQMMKAFRSIGVTEESNYKYIAVWDTFEKPVRKSKDIAKDRWVDLVAGIGAELCMKISA
ncbi:subtilisin-like protein [Xylariaceae sp. AK1471]|nr:subtilisin-like protein [Xylariaceae sp. AK1471]